MPDPLSYTQTSDPLTLGQTVLAMADIPPEGPGGLPPGKPNPSDALRWIREPPGQQGGAPRAIIGGRVVRAATGLPPLGAVGGRMLTPPKAAPKLEPALRYNGKVYVGNSHLDALDAAASEHGMATTTLADQQGLEYGYHSNGQFTTDPNYISPWERPRTGP